MSGALRYSHTFLTDYWPGQRGAVASWLVCCTPDRVVRVRALAGDIVLCSWARHFKPAAHLRKELSKLPREAVCSAFSSRVRGNSGEKFASRGREDKIKHL